MTNLELFKTHINFNNNVRSDIKSMKDIVQSDVVLDRDYTPFRLMDNRIGVIIHTRLGNVVIVQRRANLANTFVVYPCFALRNLFNNEPLSKDLLEFYLTKGRLRMIVDEITKAYEHGIRSIKHDSPWT